MINDDAKEKKTMNGNFINGDSHQVLYAFGSRVTFSKYNEDDFAESESPTPTGGRKLHPVVDRNLCLEVVQDRVFTINVQPYIKFPSSVKVISLSGATITF